MGSGGFYTQQQDSSPSLSLSLSVPLLCVCVCVCRSQSQLAQFALFISERGEDRPMMEDASFPRPVSLHFLVLLISSFPSDRSMPLTLAGPW